MRILRLVDVAIFIIRTFLIVGAENSNEFLNLGGEDEPISSNHNEEKRVDPNCGEDEPVNSIDELKKTEDPKHILMYHP